MARTVADGLKRGDQSRVTRGRGKAAGSAVMGAPRMKAPANPAVKAQSSVQKSAGPSGSAFPGSISRINTALKPKKSFINKGGS